MEILQRADQVNSIQSPRILAASTIGQEGVKKWLNVESVIYYD